MSRPWALVVSIAVVTVMILGGLLVLPAGTGARSSIPSISPGFVGSATPAAAAHTARSQMPQPPSDSPMVSAAVTSLEHGAGPARGTDAQCSVTAGGQATCGAFPNRLAGSSVGTRDAIGTGAEARVSSPGSASRWYNVTANLSAHSAGHLVPSNYFGGRLAYDPLLSEVVMFADCPTYAQCPENQTWTYNGTAWTNLTGSLTLAPSAREGAGFDYDPQLGGVVLFGGSNGANATFNDTWLFTVAGWANITLTTGIPEPLGLPPAIPGWAWGAMSWDPALNGIVAIDGCVTYSCNDVWGQTWLLTDGLWTYQGWGPATNTNSTYLAYNSVAYDAASGYLVAFGGFDYFANTSLNDTYTMNSSGVWVNITSDDAGCAASVCYTPPGRDSAAMTWDGQLDAVFLTGGFNDTSGTWLNDSWAFAHGVWLPANLTAPTAPSGYCGVAQPAMPEWSDNVAPFIIGGNGLCGASAFTNEWVYEVPPQPTFTVSPNPVDIDRSTTVNAGWTVGTGSGIVAGWNISFGDGIFDSPARNHTRLSGLEINTSLAYATAWPHTYATTGSFTVNVTWADFFYISGKTSSSATVDAALAAAITASATSITAGGTVTFSTSPTGGSGTYTYAWEFGDGNTSTVEAPPAQTYARAGTYTVNLTVTDGAGGDAKSSVTITVASAPPPPKNKSSVSPFDTYLIVGVVLAVLVILAVALLLRRRKPTGAPAPWQSGAPPGAAPPPGATGGVPPGAGGSGPPPPPPPP